MICLYNDPLARAQFHAQGLATMGIDPEWDRAVLAYVSAEVRAHAHEEFGPLADRKNDADLNTVMAGSSLGKNWRDTNEGRKVAKAFDDASAAYEAGMKEEFYSPAWSAQRLIGLTPAPSISAVVWKAAVISVAEVWNDTTLEENLAAAIDADLARLVGEKS